MTTERDPITTSGTAGTGDLDTGAMSGSASRPMVGVMDTTGTGSEDRLGQAAGGVADRVSTTISEQANVRADDQLTRAGDMLDQVAGAVRRSGEQLRTDQPQVAGFADTAANEVEKAARFLRDADLDRILAETESFARRQPALFVGAALALGFAASRFLKASPSEQDTGRYRGTYGAGYGTTSRHAGSGTGYAYGGYPARSYGSGTGVRGSAPAGSMATGVRTAEPLSDASAGEHGYDRA